MDINEHINYWISSAENDLEAANSLYNTGNYSWCLFIGHLVIEKILKAYYVKSHNNLIPPKIHNLSRLAELSNLKLDNETELFLISANKFHLEGRYPNYKNEFYKICTKEFTEKNFNKIKGFYQWLQSQII